MTEAQRAGEAQAQEKPNLGAYNEPEATGEPINPDEGMEGLKVVVDPEIGLDIVNLGLIYNVDVHENNIKVEMTLTGPACPVGPTLQSHVYRVCAGWPGARNVQADLVWSPPWDPPTMASEEAQ